MGVVLCNVVESPKLTEIQLSYFSINFTLTTSMIFIFKIIYI